jgi:hypothetical protein
VVILILNLTKQLAEDEISFTLCQIETNFSGVNFKGFGEKPRTERPCGRLQRTMEDKITTDF